MASVGELFVQIGADLSDFERSMQRVEANMRKIGKKVGDSGDQMSKGIEDSMDNIRDSIRGTQREMDRMHLKPLNTKDIDNLPSHLKPFATSLKTTQKHFQQFGKQGSMSLEQIQDQAINTRVGLDKMTSMSSSGKKVVEMLNDIGDQAKETRLAVLGLSKDGKVKISAEESTKKLQDFEEEIARARAQLEKLRDAGDFASYEAGMQNLNYQMQQVNKTMAVVGRGGRGLEQELLSLGIATEALGNRTAISMERMKDSFIRSNDMMQAKATQSSKIIKNLDSMGTRKLDQQFLKLGNRLEEMAKKGTAANLAIKDLGKDAPMKDIMDRVMLINQGLMRMQQLQMGLGIAFAAMTAIMAKASYGPSPSEVRKEQAEITQAYKDALDARAAEIYNFASLFEDVELVKPDKEKLIANLDEQVDILENWANNLKTLAKRGVDEGMIDELEKMGPKANGEIKALTTMTDKELNNYVALWKEKHRLAREQAMTELEKLKEETKSKVEELEKSLMPLGIAVEKFKSVWADALKPFIEQWGIAASKVVDFGTKIGELVKKFGEANPQIMGMVGNIIYMATGFALLLAPMAIGIKRADSFRAAFTAMFTIIRPFVIGLLSVAGTALTLAAVFVGLTYAITNMWQKSDEFRGAMAGLWTGIKAAWEQAMNPLKEKFTELGTSFQDIVTKFLGGSTSFTDRWKTIGDFVGGIIRALTPLIVNGLGAAFTILATVGGMALDLIKLAMEQLAIAFQNNGSTITEIVTGIGTFITEIFTALSAFLMEILPPVIAFIVEMWTQVYSFILEIMPLIQELVSTAFTIIGEIVNDVLPKVLAVVQAVLPAIQAIFEAVFPILLAVVKSVWGNIKNVVTSGLNIILELVDLFKNVIKGDWSAVWDNVVEILKNAFVLIWNAIQIMWVGKAVKGVVAGAKAIWTGAKAAISGMKSSVVNLFSGMKDTIVRTVSNAKTTLSTIWGAIKNGTIKLTDGLKAGVKVSFEAVKSAAQSIFNQVKDFIINPIKTAKDKVVGIIDTIVSAFRNMKITIPKPKIPTVSVKGTKKIMGVSVPTLGIDWNAKGALFRKPTVVGNQGFGEAGKEVAMPVQHRRYMKPFSNAVGQYLKDHVNNSGSGTIVKNEFKVAQLVVREEADVKRVANELERIQRQQARAKGGLSYA